MIAENKNYVELAKQFIYEHNDNNNWPPFNGNEIMAIMMYAGWLESNQLSLEKKDILSQCTNEEKRIHDGIKEHRHLERDYWHPSTRIHLKIDE